MIVLVLFVFVLVIVVICTYIHLESGQTMRAKLSMVTLENSLGVFSRKVFVLPVIVAFITNLRQLQ
jgi:hypothetical protein